MTSTKWRHTSDDEKFVGEILRSFCESRGVDTAEGIVLIHLGNGKTVCQYFGPHPFTARDVHNIIGLVAAELAKDDFSVEPA